MDEHQKLVLTKAAVVLVVAVTLIGGLGLGYKYATEKLEKDNSTEISKEQEETPMSVFTGMSEQRFDNVQFVRSLDTAASKWRTGSKFQIRGSVQGYEEGVVRIKAGEGNIIPVSLNSPALRAKCTAVTIQGPDGKPMAASQFVADYPEPEKIGKPTTAAQIQEHFPENTDMMVIAQRDGEQLVGILVIGYGCRL